MAHLAKIHVPATEPELLFNWHCLSNC